MVEVGLLRPNQPVELIDGVLVEMASEGWLHVDVKARLNHWLVLNAPATLRVIPDSTLHLPPHDAPEPDSYIYPADIPLKDLLGPNVLLVAEVAQSSLEYDTKYKPMLYGSFGIQEYWVVDLVNHQLIVHRQPRADGYAIVSRHKADESVPVPGFGKVVSLEQLLPD